MHCLSELTQNGDLKTDEPKSLNDEHQKPFLSKKEAKILFKILLKYVDDQDEDGKLIPVAMICLKLFYILTVYGNYV